MTTAVRPKIVYRDLFNRPTKEYYIDGFKYLAVFFCAGAICFGLQQLILPYSVLQTAVGSTMVARIKVVGIRFIMLSLCAFIIPNAIFYGIYHKKEEFMYLKNILAKTFGRIVGKFTGKGK